MGGEITPDKLLHNVMETLSGGDGGTSRQNSGSFLHKETPNSDTSKFSKLFGRQKPVHHVLGGGTCRLLYTYFWSSTIIISVIVCFFNGFS